VHQLDHVVMESESPEAVFELLTERFALPVAWPMAQWGPIHEGGVVVGGCNVGCNPPFDPVAENPPGVSALMFQPAGGLPAAQAELAAREVPHSEVMTQPALDVTVGDADPWRRGWALVLLAEPTAPATFLCEYAHEVDARRREEHARLAQTAGGRLGITRLAEVVVGTSGAGEESESWRRLLDPWPEVEPTTWELGGGPRTRLTAGDPSVTLVFDVEDLRDTGRALHDLDIGWEADHGDVRPSPEAVHGLDLRFRES